MAEGVTFWLDNKHATGLKAASFGDQLLVAYRNRFYVVADGAATMKGSKALRYSLSTLPAAWKKILQDESASAFVLTSTEPAITAKPPVAKKAFVKKENEESLMTESTPAASPDTPVEKPQQSSRKTPKTAGKSEENPTVRTSLTVECPYCAHKQDISVENGSNGKPFFQNCANCNCDFAVRFVAVTTYQAQVAGFR